MHMPIKLDKRQSIKWAFLLPALGYLALMAILPLVWTLTLSLMKWHANTMPTPKWVGLDNYKFFLF